MRAYYATKLSPNISRMPSGFLVCKNVPIARTGTQDYLGSEVENTEKPDEMFVVYRDESEVFDPVTLASFEGVPLVDEHPPQDVTVDNVSYLMRGFVKDVRRGEGEDSDKVIADIIVTDPIAIAEIENGKREISCGYKCDYQTDTNGRIRQCRIRGNHVALVYKGRAGQDVAIKDSKPQAKPKSERRAKFMKTQPRENFGDKLAKLLGIVTTDADPAIVADLAEQMLNRPESVEYPTADSSKQEAPPTATHKTDEPKPDTPPTTADSDEPPAWAKALIAEVAAIKAAMAPADADPLDALEEEITTNGEEKVTKPVGQMDSEDQADDGAALETAEDTADTADTSDTTDTADTADTTDTADTADTGGATDAKDAIATARKAVTGIKDEAIRRSVSDSMAGLIRQMYGVKPSTPKGSYSNILAAKKESAKRVADALPKFENMEARQAAYDSRNPHKKKEVK